MLGIDHQHGRRRKAEPGADPGLGGSQRRGAIPVPGPEGVVRVGEPDVAPAGFGKGLVRRYIAKMTGLSRAQAARLIRSYQGGSEVKPRAYQRHRFANRYTRSDIEVLAAVDEAHETLSGPAT